MSKDWSPFGGIVQAVPIEEGVEIKVPASLLDDMIAFEEEWIKLVEILQATWCLEDEIRKGGG